MFLCLSQVKSDIKTKHFNKISLVNLITGRKFDIHGIDSKDYIDDIYWSPNNKYVAFCKYKINKIELKQCKISKNNLI